MKKDWIRVLRYAGSKARVFGRSFAFSTYHLLPDGVVRRLQVGEHLEHDVLRVGAVAHGVQQVHGALAHRHVALSLQGVDHRLLRKEGRRKLGGNLIRVKL